MQAPRLAYSLDERICLDAALGVLAVGDIPPSGAFPPLNESQCAEEDAKSDFDTLGLGLPLAESKHRPFRLVFTFLGVVAGFSAFRESGRVTLGIS